MRTSLLGPDGSAGAARTAAAARLSRGPNMTLDADDWTLGGRRVPAACLVSDRGLPLPGGGVGVRRAAADRRRARATDRSSSTTRAARLRSRVGHLVVPGAEHRRRRSYAVECAAVGEVDLVRLDRQIRDLEVRIAELEARFWPTVRRHAQTACPTPQLASASMADTELEVRDRAPAPAAEPLSAGAARRPSDRRSARAALAAPRRPRAVAVPRAARNAGLARRRGALQADVDRRRLGDPPALPDDGRLHVRLRTLRQLPVERRAVPDLHVLGAPAVDVLRVARWRSRARASSPTAGS